MLAKGPFAATLVPAKVGRSIIAFVSVELDRQREDLLKDLLTKSCPAFNTMAHEFNAVCDELSRAQAPEGADLDTGDLQRRKRSLQDERELPLRQTSRI